MEGRKYDLQERLVEFAVRVISLVETLPSTRVGNHIASQLVRSGTSPASNYGEAQGAESKRDFIHKMKVGLKELRETQIWLEIITRKPLCHPARTQKLLSENDELVRIFVKCIQTAREPN